MARSRIFQPRLMTRLVSRWRGPRDQLDWVELGRRSCHLGRPGAQYGPGKQWGSSGDISKPEVPNGSWVTFDTQEYLGIPYLNDSTFKSGRSVCSLVMVVFLRQGRCQDSTVYPVVRMGC